MPLKRWKKRPGTVPAGVAAVLAALTIILVITCGCIAPGPHQESRGPYDQVTVAYSPYESTALLWIARDRHLFEENGLNVTLKRYESGAGSLDGVLRNEADISVGVTEFPVVRSVFFGADVRSIGVVDRGYFTYLVARADRGIAAPSDLRGKTIGTTFGTIAEFHLGRFIALQGIGPRDITLVDVREPDAWVNAVAEGNIDAIATAQPYADAAREKLGTNAVVWPVQSNQPLFAQAVATGGWVKAHPDTAARFLRSLAQAEDFAAADPSAARLIVQKDLNLKPEYMDTVWSQNQFGLSLDQSLVTAMEDEARWMIRNNVTNTTTVPDFQAVLYTDGLSRVRPGAVSILR